MLSLMKVNFFKWHVYGPINNFDNRWSVYPKVNSVFTSDFTYALFKVFSLQYPSTETIGKHSLYPKAIILLNIERKSSFIIFIANLMKDKVSETEHLSLQCHINQYKNNSNLFFKNIISDSFKFFARIFFFL